MRTTAHQHKQKRLLIGLLGLLLLAVGGALTYFGTPGAAALDFKASGLRLGVMCCLIWLAYPELLKMPSWLIPAVAATGLAIYRWPKLLALVPIIAGVSWLLFPRPKRPAPPGSKRKSDGNH